MAMKRKDPVAELLQTHNKKEQVSQIQQLVQMANAPTLVLAITFDSRTQKVDAKQIGAEAPNEIVQQILDAAKNLFNQQEIAKQVKLAQSGGPDVPDQVPGEPTDLIPEDLQDIPPADTEELPDAN